MRLSIRAGVFFCAIGMLGVACQHSVPVVGQLADGHAVVPTRQVLQPAGDSLTMSGRPVDLAVTPDGRFVIAKTNGGLVTIDAGSWRVVQSAPFGKGFGGSMHGLAVSEDGERVYATSAQDQLFVARIDDNGALTWEAAIAIPGPNGDDASHGCGIALDSGNNTAWICLSRNNTLIQVDLAQGNVAREIPVGVAPFDIVLSQDKSIAYVSNWGGKHPDKDDLMAPSSGTPVSVDARGVADSGTVSAVKLDSGTGAWSVEVGLHPSDLELSADGGRLYVANANSDTVSIIDTVQERVIETIVVKPEPDLPFGSAPNALALDDENAKLYVACGGNNAVAVVDVGGEEPLVEGFIPAAWYPSAVVHHNDSLFIANVKGVGSRDWREGERGWHVYWALGTLNKVTIPKDGALRRYTEVVHKNGRVPAMLRAWERGQGDEPPQPVPAKLGEPSVFEHVVYIIKENRTYDQVFGDLEQGRGEPGLCVFGREITPNHHALAEEFVLLDNFYCNGVNSADGHSWATEGNVTDHLEKSFGGFTRSYTFGNDPITYSSSGFIWDRVLAAGLSFRNYGEMDYAEPEGEGIGWEAIYRDFESGERSIAFSQNIGIANLARYSCPDYPGWNMRIPDVLRADVFLEELAQFEKSGDMPNFTIIYLPQDHGSGTRPDYPTPRAHVADNDLALGRIVEGITNSSFWPKTCIFVIEDDPQDGFDHVDGHRSICLVISPYTKRNTVVRAFYNQTSVLHTMARMLGVPPLNQMDSLAPVMNACFTNEADLTSYKARKNNIPLDEMNPDQDALAGDALRWAQQSEAMNFEQVDACDEDTLNRIIWHSVRGVDALYPAEWAGAHGTGLPERRLVLSGDDDDDDE